MVRSFVICALLTIIREIKIKANEGDGACRMLRESKNFVHYLILES
jgi:hypothetical protein